MNGGFFEAENRVREMNRIQRQYLEQSNRIFGGNMQNNSFQQSAVVNPPRFEPSVNKPSENLHQPVGNQSDNAQKDCGNVPVSKGKSDFMGLDGEKMLIMALIVVLLKEKADIKIILALVYLLT